MVDPIEVTPLAGGPAHATERAHEVVATTAAVEAPPIIHMPSPSYFPLVAAVGLFLMAAGLLVAQVPSVGSIAIPVFSIVGFFVLVGAIYGWSFEAA